MYPELDETTSWYEFLSYMECCNSLKINPSIHKFIRYNNYYKSVLEEKSNVKNS